MRAMMARKGEFDILAINDLGDPKHLAMLFKYDSVQGRYPGTCYAEGDSLVFTFAGVPAGRYPYYCLPHQAMGMKGELTIAN